MDLTQNNGQECMEESQEKYMKDSETNMISQYDKKIYIDDDDDDDLMDPEKDPDALEKGRIARETLEQREREELEDIIKRENQQKGNKNSSKSNS